MTIAIIHDRLANATLLFSAICVGWGLLNFLRKQPVTGSYWGALVILQKEAANPAARAKWKEVHDLVVDGASLADAMAKSPETFPKVYTAMVEAGETGGARRLEAGGITDLPLKERDRARGGWPPSRPVPAGAPGEVGAGRRTSRP